MKKCKKNKMPSAILVESTFEGITAQTADEETIAIRSENLFLLSVISQIEAACESVKGEYSKDLREIIRIILSPFTADEPDEEESKNAE